MNENFRGKRASPGTNFGIRKVESLGYRMVKKIAEKFNRLSRVHQRHRRQTENRQTDGIAMASSEREREFTSAKKYSMKRRQVDVVKNRNGPAEGSRTLSRSILQGE